MPRTLKEHFPLFRFFFERWESRKNYVLFDAEGLECILYYDKIRLTTYENNAEKNEDFSSITCDFIVGVMKFATTQKQVNQVDHNVPLTVVEIVDTIKKLKEAFFQFFNDGPTLPELRLILATIFREFDALYYYMMFFSSHDIYFKLFKRKGNEIIPQVAKAFMDMIELNAQDVLRTTIECSLSLNVPALNDGIRRNIQIHSLVSHFILESILVNAKFGPSIPSETLLSWLIQRFIFLCKETNCSITHDYQLKALIVVAEAFTKLLSRWQIHPLIEIADPKNAKKPFVREVEDEIQKPLLIIIASDPRSKYDFYDLMTAEDYLSEYAKKANEKDFFDRIKAGFSICVPKTVRKFLRIPETTGSALDQLFGYYPPLFEAALVHRRIITLKSLFPPNEDESSFHVRISNTMKRIYIFRTTLKSWQIEINKIFDDYGYTPYWLDFPFSFLKRASLFLIKLDSELQKTSDTLSATVTYATEGVENATEIFLSFVRRIREEINEYQAAGLECLFFKQLDDFNKDQELTKLQDLFSTFELVLYASEDSAMTKRYEALKRIVPFCLNENSDANNPEKFLLPFCLCDNPLTKVKKQLPFSSIWLEDLSEAERGRVERERVEKRIIEERLEQQDPLMGLMPWVIDVIRFEEGKKNSAQQAPK